MTDESENSPSSARPGPERLAKFLEVEKGYTPQEAAALVRKYPLIVAQYIMRGDFVLGATAMAIEMKEAEQASPPEAPPAP